MHPEIHAKSPGDCPICRMKPGNLDTQIRTLVPGYMTMGHDGIQL